MEYALFFYEEFKKTTKKSKVFSLLFLLAKSGFTSKDRSALIFIYSLIPLLCSIHLLKNYLQTKENKDISHQNFEGFIISLRKIQIFSLLQGLEVILHQIVSYIQEIQQQNNDNEEIVPINSQILSFFEEFNVKTHKKLILFI